MCQQGREPRHPQIHKEKSLQSELLPKSWTD